MVLSISDNILSGLLAFLAPLVGVAMLVFCVIQGFKLAKGVEGASVKKLVGGVALFLFILGLMYLTGSYKTLGDLFKNFTDKAITGVANDGTNIINGNSGSTKGGTINTNKKKSTNKNNSNKNP